MTHEEAKPLIDAITRTWDDYVATGNLDRLLLEVQTAPDDLIYREANRWYLERALEIADWRAAEALWTLGIRVSPEESGEPGPLHCAIDGGDRPDIIRWLIAHGASLEWKGFNGYSPLHYACGSGRIQIARTLIELGADVNRRTPIDGGDTPLILAAEAGHLEIVRLLLEHGADPEIRNTYVGHTAADMAKHEKHWEIVDCLEDWMKKREVVRKK